MKAKKQTEKSLKKVQKQFEEWRAIKKVREPIPEKLWEAVEKLLESYKKTEVVRGLGLNHTALLNRLKRKKRGKTSNPEKYNFIEVDINNEPFLSCETNCEFTLEDVNGRKLEVRGVKVREVIIIVREIWGGKH